MYIVLLCVLEQFPCLVPSQYTSLWDIQFAICCVVTKSRKHTGTTSRTPIVYAKMENANCYQGACVRDRKYHKRSSATRIVGGALS